MGVHLQMWVNDSTVIYPDLQQKLIEAPAPPLQSFHFFMRREVTYTFWSPTYILLHIFFHPVCIEQSCPRMKSAVDLGSATHIMRCHKGWRGSMMVQTQLRENPRHILGTVGVFVGFLLLTLLVAW
jgi:hypothetical protein